MVRWPLILFVSAFVGRAAVGDDAIPLQERFPAGYQYHVSSRVHLTGELTVPPDKDNPKEQVLPFKGQSAIDYDERVLETAASTPSKTVRIYKRLDFQRQIGKQEQGAALRQPVHRLVILRRNQNEVPFSPDGPLLYAEIDLVRTDVFTPALAGLLPEQSVRPGDTWKATLSAVTELTDMDKIDDGAIDCRFEDVVTIGGRKHARVALTGSVRGVNEDGPNRQELDGFFYFDLTSNHLSYMSLKGKHYLLDKQGKTTGKIEGTFTLARQVLVKQPDLSDTALRGVNLEPNADNTLLLYDNPEIGVKFLYGRRWRVGNVQGRQLLLDDNDNKGNGILLTLEDLKSTPEPAQFLREADAFVKEQKGRVLGTQAPRELQAGAQAVQHFAIEAELSGQKILLDYYSLRQAEAGATIAARILPADIQILRPQIERFARSIVLAKAKAAQP